MKLSTQIAKHFRAIHFGGNWTSVNLRDTLNDVTLKEACTKIQNLNTIAALTFHLNYYVRGVMKVLQGGPLEIRDKFSFDHPNFQSEASWQTFLAQCWSDAENFAKAIESLSENQFAEIFVEEKYGSYYANIHGIIEHAHYHLGQIVFIKKLIK